MSIPMPPPASKEKEKLKQWIGQGEFMLGQEVVEREYTHFSVAGDQEQNCYSTKDTTQRH